jgi:hypothetical protein
MLEQEIIGLRKALSNRDSTISRLESERREILVGKDKQENQQQTIRNLQRLLAENESKKPTEAVAGRLITRINQNNGRPWLFISFSGTHMLLENSLVKQAGVTSEEIILVHLDNHGNAIGLESLEGEGRLEVLGVIKTGNETLSLQTQHESFPINIPINNAMINQPAKAVFLPQLPSRAAGIYAVNFLESQEQPEESLYASIKQIKDYLGADKLNSTLFYEELKRHNTVVSAEGKNGFVFTADFRKIIDSIRPFVTVQIYCRNQSCLRAAESVTAARSGSENEICDICGEVCSAGSSSYDFSGKKLIIFGGDRVGNEYRSNLEKCNLKVNWYSGFDNMHQLKDGLGNPDLVVIITRQISHTLLICANILSRD